MGKVLQIKPVFLESNPFSRPRCLSWVILGQPESRTLQIGRGNFKSEDTALHFLRLRNIFRFRRQPADGNRTPRYQSPIAVNGEVANEMPRFDTLARCYGDDKSLATFRTVLSFDGNERIACQVRGREALWGRIRDRRMAESEHKKRWGGGESDTHNAPI